MFRNVNLVFFRVPYRIFSNSVLRFNVEISLSPWSFVERALEMTTLSCPQGTVEVNGQRLPLVIAGDQAYPLQPWLMKAYPSAQEGDPSKALFNLRLGAARVVVEHAFGRLKCRWRRILKRSEHSYRNVPRLAFARYYLA